MLILVFILNWDQFRNLNLRSANGEQIFFIKTIKTIFKRNVAVIVALFVSCNPGFILIALNGLETSLFILILCIYLYRLVKCDSSSNKEFILLGIIAGFLFLARTDSFFIIAMSMLFYFIITRNEYLQKKFINILIWGVTSIIIASPWLLYNYVNFGTLIQDSSNSLTILLLRELFIGFGANVASYFQLVFLNIVRMIKVLPYYSGYPLIFISFLLIYGLFIALLWKREKSNLFIGILLSFLIYTVLLHSFRISPREYYMAPFLDLTILIFALLLSNVIDLLFKKISHKNVFLIFSFGLLILCASFPILTIGDCIFKGEMQEPFNMNLYNTIPNYVNPLINNESLNNIGISDAGIYGWFSSKPIINLDGLVNHEAYEHIITGDMINFLRQKNIFYFIIRPPLKNEWYMGNGSGLWFISIPIYYHEKQLNDSTSKDNVPRFFIDYFEIQKLLKNNSEISKNYYKSLIMPHDINISHYLGNGWAIPYRAEYRSGDHLDTHWFPFTSHYSKSNDYATSKGSESNIYLPLKLNESYWVNLSLSLNTKQESNISKIFIIDNQTQITAPILPNITNLTLNITATHDVTHIIMSNPDNEQDSSSVNLWGIYITNLSDTTTQYQ